MIWPAEHQEQFATVYHGAGVCLTGGAGFIGAHLLEALLTLGARVAILDDLSSSTSARLTELLDRRFLGDARFIHASILEPRALTEAMSDAQMVFHLAAVSSAVQANDEPVRCVQVNALGTARVAESARAAGADRLIYAASASAYGDAIGPNRESQATMPISPYAASKLAGEHIVCAWAKSRSLDGVSLRFFNVYGAGQSPQSDYAAVIPAFAKRLDAGQPPILYGDGSQSRDFVHVHDVVTALLLAGSNERPLGGATVNIGSGSSVSIVELAEVMARVRGVSGLKPVHEAPRPGDIQESRCDPTLATKLLGFSPFTPFETGLARLVDERPNRSAAAV